MTKSPVFERENDIVESGRGICTENEGEGDISIFLYLRCILITLIYSKYYFYIFKFLD